MFIRVASYINNVRVFNGVYLNNPPNYLQYLDYIKYQVNGEKFPKLYFSSRTVRMMKSRRMRWAERPIFSGKTNADESFVGRVEGTKPITFINPLKHEISLISTKICDIMT